MKKLILMLALVIGAFFSSWSQKVPTAEELAKKNVEELEKRLKLTPTQRNIVYNYIYDLSKNQLFFYKKQQAGTFKEEDETQFYRLTNETHKNIKNVLKPEQVQEYNKIVEERLSGIDPNKKKKKLKKGEEEEKVVGIEGLKSTGNN